MQREELIEALEAPGLLVLPNVTNKVKLLIAADPDSEFGEVQKLENTVFSLSAKSGACGQSNRGLRLVKRVLNHKSYCSS